MKSHVIPLIPIALLGLVLSCESKSPGPAESTGSGGDSIGGEGAGGSEEASTVPEATGPLYHPPAGFEDCKHSEVRAECSDGWCRIPAGCFVMGSPETEWRRGQYNEDRIAVTLSRSMLMQQTELTRKQWMDLVGAVPPEGLSQETDDCPDDDCPVRYVSWWEAVHAANLLSEKEGLTPCYELSDCTGEIGRGMTCAALANVGADVYGCEGYRLPTSHEYEYTARAGTTTAFYSGGILEQPDVACRPDKNLDKVAWYCNNSEGRPHQVAQLEPNGFGLYDQIGNVLELLSDHHWNTSSPGGIDPVGSLKNSENVVTTPGTYETWSFTHRVAARFQVDRGARGQRMGFRLVRTLQE